MEKQTQHLGFSKLELPHLVIRPAIPEARRAFLAFAPKPVQLVAGQSEGFCVKVGDQWLPVKNTAEIVGEQTANINRIGRLTWDIDWSA